MALRGLGNVYATAYSNRAGSLSFSPSARRASSGSGIVAPGFSPESIIFVARTVCFFVDGVVHASSPCRPGGT